MKPPGCYIFHAVIVLCAVLGAGARAYANDTAAGGSGSDIVPLATADVRMAAEDILIVHEGIDWVIEADYTFENLSKKPLTLQIAFPEYACEGREAHPEEMCDSKPLRYESMRTKVNGKPVAHRKGMIKAGHPWRPRLGQVWLFDATFEVGKPTRIHHSYRVHETEDSSGGRAISYVTRTGATWAGTIGHARFRVRIPFEATEIYPPEDTGLALTMRAIEVDGKKLGELLLEARDWEPVKDLSVYYNATPGGGFMYTDSVGEGAPRVDTPDPYCPQLGTIWIRGSMLGEPNPNDAVDPNDTVDKWAEKLAPQGLGSAKHCRAYIYAYRGKDLGSDDLNKYFYGPEGHKDRGWPYKHFQPNPYYSDALLTKGDLTTLELIDAIDARIQGASNVPTASQTPARTHAPDGPPKVTLSARGCGCSIARAPALPQIELLFAALGFSAIRLRRRRSQSRLWLSTKSGQAH
jgi:MYXO-CTERM domain-containing protein